MKKIITADGSESFLNEDIAESYHSQTGAVEEALKKFVQPCEIRKKARTGKLRILDVCFGLGYNSAMAVSEALSENAECVIEVIGLEKDSEIIDNISLVNPDISFFSKYQKLNKEKLVLNESNVNVKILLGDAKETVKNISAESFDAIFFDPFSPSKVPEMWSVEFFKEMFRVLDKEGILATYSCARMVRDNLKDAEFYYADGPKVGRRGPGTIARKVWF